MRGKILNMLIEKTEVWKQKWTGWSLESTWHVAKKQKGFFSTWSRDEVNDLKLEWLCCGSPHPCPKWTEAVARVKCCNWTGNAMLGMTAIAAGRWTELSWEPLQGMNVMDRNISFQINSQPYDQAQPWGNTPGSSAIPTFDSRFVCFTALQRRHGNAEACVRSIWPPERVKQISVSFHNDETTFLSFSNCVLFKSTVCDFFEDWLCQRWSGEIRYPCFSFTPKHQRRLPGQPITHKHLWKWAPKALCGTEITVRKSCIVSHSPQPVHTVLHCCWRECKNLSDINQRVPSALVLLLLWASLFERSQPIITCQWNLFPTVTNQCTFSGSLTKRAMKTEVHKQHEMCRKSIQRSRCDPACCPCYCGHPSSPRDNHYIIINSPYFWNLWLTQADVTLTTAVQPC